MVGRQVVVGNLRFGVSVRSAKISKVPGFRFDGSGRSFQTAAVKVSGLDWSAFGKPGYKAQGFNVVAAQRFREQNVPEAGVKQATGRGWFGKYQQGQGARNFSSKSDSRKAAAAAIAKIPFPLANHVARVFA
jgi:hypothetical protein